MEKFDIYKDISMRTNGDMYIGVVGPARTGKSTFITKFMQTLVLPNINNKLQKQIATDEMPQSGAGKTVMTSEPKFIPSNSVKVTFKNKSSANVRLIDCVGYMVEGANGIEEDGKPRMVKTPWSNEEIPFVKAAEIGTKKVIDEYSTFGIMVTCDGTICDIERENYISAEEKTVKDLKSIGKPFVIVVNSKNPNGDVANKLCDELENKYGVSVICKNVYESTADDITDVIEKVLYEFPMGCINISLPKWMQAMSLDNDLIDGILCSIKSKSKNVCKMKDFAELDGISFENDDLSCMELNEIKLESGDADYKISANGNLFYKVLSKECNEKVSDEYELLNYMKTFTKEKKRYEKIKNALNDAEQNGYGVVLPTLEEMNLEEPVLVKQNGKYGVKLKATAPSLHIMKVDVSSEVSPIVGTEKQGEELVNYLQTEFDDDKSKIWDTNMFGKSLHDLVNDGLSDKLTSIPKDAQQKMRKTLTKIVNEGRGGMICILL